MYKNQLQEICQKNRLPLPSYSCTKYGPDHDARYKAVVIFNGESFKSAPFCKTIKEAESSAAESALQAQGGLWYEDATPIYKNLLQKAAHTLGVAQPTYTVTSSGPDHDLTFSCTVKCGGMTVTGRPAKTKKKAEHNGAEKDFCSVREAAENFDDSMSDDSM